MIPGAPRWVIRPLKTLPEFLEAEQLQRRVWRLGPGDAVVSPSLMIPMAKSGGVVLGAFEESAMVGMSVGFVGLDENGAPLLWSHVTGVAEERRAMGLGESLKWAQREAALSQGIRLIRWTFDPLEGRNASLNFAKLGVISRIYARNIYGELNDGLNAGMPSDRLVVDWQIDSDRVRQRLKQGRPRVSVAQWRARGACVANPTEADRGSMRRICDLHLDLDAQEILIETPAHIQALKQSDPGLARDWRLKIRTAFETYFAAGYEAREFAGEMHEGTRRNFALLAR